MDEKLESAGTATSTRRNAILKYSVICPICGASSFQYNLNTRMFWNNAQDVDLQPRDYQCMKGLENYHPPLYYMWHCPQCHFTASYRYFSEPLKDVHIRPDVIQQKIRETTQSSEAFRTVVAVLGEGIDNLNPDYCQAIKLHLLGIHYYELIETLLKQNFIILARYYLRLAWLYRDMKDRPAILEQTAPKLFLMTEALKKAWPELPDGEEPALRKAIKNYALTLEDSLAMKSAVDEVNVIQLMARIHYKLAEYRKAQVLLMDSVDRAVRARMTIDQQLKTPPRESEQKLTAEESGELISKSRKLESLIGDAQVLLDQIRDKTYNEQMQQAKGIIAGMPGKPLEEVREALTKARIDAKLISQLVPEPQKKKSMFGFLR
ncbi:MAG TPA: hypothetical protein DCZ95_01110 [Verrucomicrobia bacterium]|nr:MAG: hypothetical protein A2X46_00930 [Lentisphaerae bacterium GWF2_57_35]HBA82667.1 hypothetical protein [Verrucomicrobiota bacterium]